MDVIVWRHPRPEGVAGRCIGQVDVPVGHRKAKRLAHRVRSHFRRMLRTQPMHSVPEAVQPPVVWTSHLQRASCVGRVLRCWGWQHRIDPRLAELNFGTWDGQPWSAITKEEVDAWCADFAHAAPSGGESVAQLMGRCEAFVQDLPPGAAVHVVIGHAGWISALRRLFDAEASTPLTAQTWPMPLRYSQSHRQPLGMLLKPPAV